ncbi:MAG: hypothetical protein WBQ26_07185 [Gemmatimonadaceae bacterium]
MRTVRSYLLLFVTCACGGPTVLPPAAPTPLRMSGAANAADYAKYLAAGTAAIDGRVFVTTQGDDVTIGAGRLVTLDPVTRYTEDWFRQIGADFYRFDEAPADSLFRLARRITTSDAQGHFGLAALPAGTYLVRSSVMWKPGEGFAGPLGVVVADTLTVGDGERRNILLNVIVMHGPLLTSAILTKAQIGDRRFAVVGRVTGISCRKDLLTEPPPDQSVARSLLVVNALVLGAGAVTNVICEKGGFSLRHNCFSYIECRGDAIRWSP